MAKSITDEKISRLYEGILTLRNAEECRAFFEDLCTVKELQEMSRRLTAAQMLREGKIYAEIAQATGLSTATICRVNRALRYGNDGYESVLQRLCGDTDGKEEEKKKE